MNQLTLQTFSGQVVSDMAAAFSAVMTKLGVRLGLYQAMDGAGPLTPAQLSRKTGTHERYVREWLNNQAAGGYVRYQADAGTYELPEEHAMVLAREESPVFMAGGFGNARSMWLSEDRIADAFCSGNGIGWHEHDSSLHFGTEYFFRTGYRAHLTTSWIPSLDGVEDKLKAGAVVADVGCGHGASTIIMAEAYPNSMFWGFDYHPESIRTAEDRARTADVGGRARFETCSAKGYPMHGYDLICFMDSLHDMGDPLGAARHARKSINPDGAVMLVEPFAGDNPEDNFTPVGRLFYAASTAFCTPNSLSQEVKTGLGAQAGEAQLRAIFRTAGFTRFRRASQTPFNLILEARP